MERGITLKNFTSKVDDVSKGKVVIYVNAFNNEDTDGEISDPKSFNKTISDGIERIKHLKDHNKTLLIGAPLEMSADSFGLKVISALNINKPLAKDVYEDYKFMASINRTMEHSIGAYILKQEFDATMQAKRNLEYKLFEYSTLSFLGANELATTISIKDAEQGNDLIREFNLMLKQDYSKERLEYIEKNITLIEKVMAEQLIVTCKSCGLGFDYNSCEEITVEQKIQQLMVQYARWVIEDTVWEEMQKLEPEIRDQVMAIIESQKGINLENAFNHVRCPKCWSIVTKSLNTKEPVIETTQKDKPIDYKLLTKNFNLKK